MIRPAIVPAYLLLCLLLGGASAAGFAPNLFLQLLALPLIAWGLLARDEDRPPAATRSLLAVAALLGLVLAAQLVPLPPSLWGALPGRGPIIEGYRLLGVPAPWLPLSLAPEPARESLLWLLPAFAVLMGVGRIRAFRPAWIAWVVVVAASIGVGIGAVQILDGDDSPLYFYEITNKGQAVGLFANANHAATLLVAAIPFAVALQAKGASRARSGQQAPALMVITSAFLLVIAGGLAINTSLAGIGLGIAAATASVLLMRARDSQRLTLGLALTGILVIAGTVAIFLGPNNITGAAPGGPQLEQLTRRVSIPTTFAASAHYLPFGSGLGTFREIYQQMENPLETISTYMNHAHSDVAEVVLETGVPGIILMLLLLVWWTRRTIAIWRATEPDYFARAAAIASGAIMAHSLVDYPLRTAAISALFAACLALMADIRPRSRIRADRLAGRHVRVT